MPDPIIIDKSEPRALNVVGERITVLASGAQSGSFEIFVQSGPEGSGPPPHSHPWDEAFYVTRGEIAFGVGERTALARPGTLVHIPAGTTHWFRFAAGGGEMVSVTSARAPQRCSGRSTARSPRRGRILTCSSRSPPGMAPSYRSRRRDGRVPRKLAALPDPGLVAAGRPVGLHPEARALCGDITAPQHCPEPLLSRVRGVRLWRCRQARAD